MAKDQGVKTPARGPAGKAVRTAPTGKAAPPAPATAKATAVEPLEKKTSPQQFWREVQVEARKITWTPWRETWITSVMVGIMVVVTSLFFFLVDSSMSLLMQQFLRLASGA